MIKTYRKVATIKAEQFDGSNEMVNRYDIKTGEKYLIRSANCHFILPTLEGGEFLYIGNWIATGIDGEHWIIQDDIFKKTYVEVK
ncbi:hypothetical protein [Companilactobacillus bobalius]|uniref:Phage protein n=2 Tax=Companilactobacillus bobalius TaxID=2801451 RepID=A0A202F3B1_9LACO|nr:hypothetical protein [Companilactobacillus bobalius]KRK84560.1 hypothetical protein FC78_GL000792 [Companilactobacillus bobalius DSM 19674]OVE94955.1 hypothetical protein LKACC16343_02755 [Companilactobacillus bobalius]GEO59596.1 hypothetical protein LBO01_27250 [Companilactobacillus paralimentarius]